ncbi:MAG: sugar transferase, partial [Alphaproteobacteria bacterium]
MKTSVNSLATVAKDSVSGPVMELHSSPLRSQNEPGILEETGHTAVSLRTASSHEMPCSAHMAHSHVAADARYDVPLGGWVKRVFDLIIATTTLIMMAPTMLVIACLIYLTQGGPVLFVEPRVGFNRRMFRCFRFRTMTLDADQRLARYLATNQEAASMWQEHQKLRYDPRVTWLGHILRQSSLDKLPQLFNVLRGEMSCIGPSPIVAEELLRYGS